MPAAAPAFRKSRRFMRILRVDERPMLAGGAGAEKFPRFGCTGGAFQVRWRAMIRLPRSLLAIIAGFLLVVAAPPSGAAPKLKVSDDRRFIVKEDGMPFFYLGDTAWELFHRLNREEAERYLKNRAEKQFTVIQAVVLAELDGLNDPN